MKKIILLFLSLLANTFIFCGNTIYIVPFTEHDPNFEDPYGPNSDGNHAFCSLLRSFIDKGYTVKSTTTLKNLPDVAYIICFNMPTHSPSMMHDLESYPKSMCWVSLWEPPVVIPQYYYPKNLAKFGKVFTLFDDMVDGTTFYKFHYPQGNLTMINPVVDFNNKKLCTTVIGNKSSNHPDELYSERRKLLNFFEEINEDQFEFYGGNWPSHYYKRYKGSTPSKIDTIKNYKFCICYENMRNQRGYITEKIFDAMLAGTIPIYWGATNITDYIPADCFVSRENFANNQELYLFMKNMPEDTYNSYINRIRDFLSSDKAYLFSKKNFRDTFLRELK
jgi:hypothetical protein